MQFRDRQIKDNTSAYLFVLVTKISTICLLEGTLSYQHKLGIWIEKTLPQVYSITITLS